MGMHSLTVALSIIGARSNAENLWLIRNKTKPNFSSDDFVKALCCLAPKGLCMFLLQALDLFTSLFAFEVSGQLWLICFGFQALIWKWSPVLTTVIGCKGLIIVRRRILLASEQAPLLSPLRTLSLTGKKNAKPKINVSSIVNQLESSPSQW